MLGERQEKALEILGKIQESMVAELLEDLVENEDDYAGALGFDNSYNFSLQDLEDKYAMKLWNIQRFINEVYKLDAASDAPDHRVDIIFANREDLGKAINKRLEQLKPISLIDVKIQKEDEAYMAMIVYTPFDPASRLIEG
ncbi:MAG: hypothetical protein O7H41_21635 [Planctomycetota bacterium]|nr:hypothetical protein [Planctomycetota bacterium]